MCLLKGEATSDEDLIALGEGKKVVVVGSSFISMEIVATIAKPEKKLGSIDVVGTSSVPFKSMLGEQIGNAIMNVRLSLPFPFFLYFSLPFVDGGSSTKRMESSSTCPPTSKNSKAPAPKSLPSSSKAAKRSQPMSSFSASA